MLEYKGYAGEVTFDNTAGELYGRVLGTRDVITFVGQSVADIRQAFRESVDGYLAFCAELGEKPEPPCTTGLSGTTHGGEDPHVPSPRRPTMLTYRKYSVTVTGGGLSSSQIIHTQAHLISLLLEETAKGHEVSVQERWLPDQGAGPCEGEGRPLTTPPTL